MSNEEITNLINKSLEGQDVFRLKGVDYVNHKPHPFMIGPQHVKHASDNYRGILGDATLKAIPCAMTGCSLSYDEHTSDHVAFLQLMRNAGNEEAREVLKKIVSDIGEKTVDGFALVETPEKFRIS